MTLRFDPKDPAERLPLAFNFVQDMDAVAANPAPVVTVSHLSGEPDASPNTIKDGSPTIQGTKVIQWVVAGVAGARYLLRCEAYRADGAKLVIVGELLVRTAAAA